MKTIVILNIRSGRQRGRKPLVDLIPEFLERHGLDATIHRTESPDEIAPLVDAAGSTGVRRVIVGGGDGTVSSVARQLVGKDFALGIVPTGSGNGLARHLGIPLDPERAIEAITTGEERMIDSAEVDGVPFFVTMGVGFDAEVAHRFASSRARGLRTYVSVGFRSWLRYEPDRYEITVDGRTIEQKAFVVTVANAGQYGNDAIVAPQASIEDGVLDLVTVRTGSLAAAPSLVWRLFAGRSFDRSPHVTSFRGREITIHRRGPGPAHIDGEPVTLGATIRASVRASSLRVIVPAATGGV